MNKKTKTLTLTLLAWALLGLAIAIDSAPEPALPAGVEDDVCPDEFIRREQQRSDDMRWDVHADGLWSNHQIDWDQ